MIKKIIYLFLITINAIGASLVGAEYRELSPLIPREEVSNGIPRKIDRCRNQLPSSMRKLFDEVVEKWQTHLHENQGIFDIEVLLDSLSLSAKNASEEELRDLIGSTMLLWDVGLIRSTNVLAAALLQHTSASPEEIESRFGKEIRRSIEELRELSYIPAIAEQAPFLTLNAQLILLSNRIQNFLKHKHDTSMTPISTKIEREILHGLQGTSDLMEQLYESLLDEASAKNQ